MAKHIVGLILFSFIVGTSAVVAGLFASAPERSRSFSSSKYFSINKRKKRRRRCCCRKRRRRMENVSVTITNAEYDLVGHRLATTVSFGEGAPGKADLDLHFYVRDEHGTRYLKTETVPASTWTQRYVNRFPWLERFGEKRDLYIIPQLKTLNNGWTTPPAFDVVRAAPVRLRNFRYFQREMGH